MSRHAPRDYRGFEWFLMPGDPWFGDGPARVRTLLGSCVAVTLWHPRRHCGGICHFLLPTRRGGRAADVPLDGRYGDEAIELLLREVSGNGTRAAQYQVKLFGGGRMYDTHTQVGTGNVAQARRLVETHGLTLSACHTGGDGHRNLIFDLDTGHVWLRHQPQERARS